MKKTTVLLSLGLTLGSLSVASFASAGGAGGPVTPPAPSKPGCMSIAALLSGDPQFSTLLTAVQAAGLAETLASGSYTVFAPTNAAFAKVPSDTLAGLLNDPAMLKSVLLYHVVPGKVNARQVMSLKSAKTANGATVSIRVMGGKVMVNNATVVKADVMACNGIVHVIDTVLMPPMAAAPAAPAPVAAAPAPTPVAAPAAPVFNVANVPVTPQPRTTPVTAPATTDTSAATTDTSAATTDTSATATTTDTTATTDTSATTTTDAAATTDTSATTTTDTAATTDTSATTTTDAAATTDTSATTTTDTTTTDTAAVASNTIYDVVANDDRFSTLAGLLSDAGLDETLMSGEYTLLAPTNEAFARLDENTLAVLASDPVLLKRVLLFHVLPGTLPAVQITATAQNQASGSNQLNTAEGASLNVSVSGSILTVSQGKSIATIVAPDIKAGNGLIHAIDAVLLPPDVSIPSPVSLPVDTSTTPAATTTDTAATTTSTTTTATTTASTAATYTFKHNPIPDDASAAGTAVATTTGTDVTTVLTLTGLTAGKEYIAHYHAFGPASSTDACASNGPVTAPFPNFTADASGNATVTMTTAASTIAGDLGAYINVHYASDASVIPICAPVKMTKG